jgi:exopolyphosphatase/guanosine-5'-triphosphate,3'-diphosphate pyrophosphatase
MTIRDARIRGRLGVIDLGSNTILLLVVEPDGRVVEDCSRITRLGQGVFASGALHRDAIERTRTAVVEFAQRARALGAARVVGVGTEALRRARDGGEFLAGLERSGLLDRARLLDGEEEAACAIEATRRAAAPDARVIVIDVGGGSTELAWTEAGGRVRGISLPLGSVRLTEELLARHPVPRADMDRLEARLEQAVGALAALRADGLEASGAEVVAVAGTATTLAAMDQELEPYDAERVEGYRIAIERLEGWIDRLAGLDLEQRRRVPGLEPGRADVIVAGLVLLRAVIRAIGARELRASGRGVRHGVALRLLEDPGFLG